MDRFWDFWFEMFRYGEELFIITMVLSIGMQRRSKFWLRVMACAAVFAVLPFPLAFWLDACNEAFIVSAFIYCILMFLCIGALFLCRKGFFTNIIFIFYSAFGTRMFVSVIRNIIRLLITGNSEEYITTLPWLHIVYYILLAASCAAVYFFFIKSLYTAEKLKLNAQVLIYYAFIMIINVLLNTVRMTTDNMSVTNRAILELSAAFYYLLIVSGQAIIMKQANAQAENYFIRRMWENDKSQYTQSRAKMEALQVQHHDLKHVVAHLKAEGVNESYIGTIEKVMSDYSAYVDCGNKYLDVVLSEKKNICNLEKIACVLAVNGKVLDFMNAVDIYSLFGNALDNAIKYLKTLDDPQKKFLNVSVSEEQGMAVAKIENYFDGVLQFKNGLPVTSQQDENYHGFGMKSMQRIIKKYGGNLFVTAGDGLFIVKFIIPVSQIQKSNA